MYAIRSYYESVGLEIGGFLTAEGMFARRFAVQNRVSTVDNGLFASPRGVQA